MNTYSLIALIVGIITFAAGILFKILGDSTSRTMCQQEMLTREIEIDVKASNRRIEILERLTDVFSNEFLHINRKLDSIQNSFPKI